ncbi:Os09g0261750 [Oryza sativa Japonica Group]|uniref:Os09g0261750 protein n=1 Tax=Oryza sativa subsp. japonica TaxID=39947 RepID=A0A0P0XKR9_ORYSJ|nr:Os09g0261750 [Oryza sativa Japonica Group]
MMQQAELHALWQCQVEVVVQHRRREPCVHLPPRGNQDEAPSSPTLEAEGRQRPGAERRRNHQLVRPRIRRVFLHGRLVPP